MPKQFMFLNLFLSFFHAFQIKSLLPLTVLLHFIFSSVFPSPRFICLLIQLCSESANITELATQWHRGSEEPAHSYLQCGMFPLTVGDSFDIWSLSTQPCSSEFILFIYTIPDTTQTAHAEILSQSLDLSARLNRDKETGNDRIET